MPRIVYFDSSSEITTLVEVMGLLYNLGMMGCIIKYREKDSRKGAPIASKSYLPTLR